MVYFGQSLGKYGPNFFEMNNAEVIVGRPTISKLFHFFNELGTWYTFVAVQK